MVDFEMLRNGFINCSRNVVVVETKIDYLPSFMHLSLLVLSALLISVMAVASPPPVSPSPRAPTPPTPLGWGVRRDGLREFPTAASTAPAVASGPVRCSTTATCAAIPAPAVSAAKPAQVAILPPACGSSAATGCVRLPTPTTYLADASSDAAQAIVHQLLLPDSRWNATWNDWTCTAAVRSNECARRALSHRTLCFCTVLLHYAV